MAKSREQYIAENSDYNYNEDLIAFSLIDKATVTGLKKTVNETKDEDWNMKQLNSKLLQGILNGDPVQKIADSFLAVVGNNKASAERNARTMVTGAENKGRQDSYENLADQGVVQKKVWIATPDDRTRESHFELDGEEVDIDQAFSNELMFPGDQSGDPSEWWNCRCSMRDHIIGFRKPDGSIKYVNSDRGDTLHSKQMQEEKERRTVEEKQPAEERETSKGTITRDYDCDFAKNYGKEYYDAMCDLVDNCDNENFKIVWEKYHSQIVAQDPNCKKGAYCSLNSVHVNKAKDSVGSFYEMPYEVMFHESGHATDFLTKDLADTNGLKLKFSSAYQDGLFPNTIKEEVQALVDQKDAELKELFKEHKDDYEWLHDYGFISDYAYYDYQTLGSAMPDVKYSKSVAYAAIEAEIKGIGEGLRIADLSDILEGATKGKISCGYGHGKSYWKPIFGVEEKLATEAFAEMTSATAVNGKSLEMIKQYLPKSYEVYNDMLKDIASK